MKFNLKKPCGKMCPFHVQCLNGWLGKERAEDIAEALLDQQQTFACHKTTEMDDETGEGIVTDNSQHCAGALIMLERMERPNQLMRISERLGGYDRRKLDMDAPVFDNDEIFINHHTNKKL